MDFEALLAAVLTRASGAESEIHGERHWRAVAFAAAQLADLLELAGEEVDRELLLLFALLHDSCRFSDDYDPEHGERAAALALELAAEDLLQLSGSSLSLLCHSLRHHDQGFLSDQTTIGACWDADRLNLWRVGVEPLPELLSTAVAEELIEAAAQYHSQAPEWDELALLLEGGEAGPR